MPAAYPPPPTDAPAAPHARIDKAKVLAICRTVEELSPVQDAMRAHGVSETGQDWAKKAERGQDPFWAWAVTCLEIAQGQAVRVVSSKLLDKIHEGDTKAITFFLAKRVEGFQEKKVVDVNHTHGGTVSHEIAQRANRMLLDGELTLTELVERKRAQQVSRLGETAAEDLLEAEPHPMFLLKNEDDDGEDGA